MSRRTRMRFVITISMLATAIAASLGASFGASFGALPRSAQRPAPTNRGGWTKEERALLRSLSLASLAPLAPDPSNRVSEDSSAARLGQRLFFDARLSANGKVSCASCHVPEQDFQDGRPL